MGIARIAITLLAAAVGAWLVWGCYLLQRDREGTRILSLDREDAKGEAPDEGLAPLHSRTS